MSCRRFLSPCLFVVLAYSQCGYSQISKANRILIDRGLQLQGMVTKDDVFHLNTYSNANYTSINWIFESNPSLMGPAPGFPWSRWVGDETQMPKSDELAYLPQLITLQLADEWFLDDPAVLGRATNWFNSVRNDYPNTIIYANNYGGQVSDSGLFNFIATAKPDLVCFDTYPWHNVYTPTHDGAPMGGPPLSWYYELRRYRDITRASNIPFFAYVDTFHAVQDYDSTAYRDPSASELRLNHSAALAFNAKGLIDFTYNTGASSLFTKPGGDSYPTALFADKTESNLRARNLGKALVLLKPIDEATGSWTTSMMFLRGKDANTNLNAVPSNFIQDPQDANYTDWVFLRNDPYLNGWSVTNKANVKNNGQRGDVIVSWFKPLDESFDGTNYNNEIYMVVVNGLTDTNGTAADCQQEIRFTFAFGASGITSVVMLDPLTGTLQTNVVPTLPPPNAAKRQLVLTLNGGDAALFKFADGAPFVGFVPPTAARTSATVQTNVPVFSIQGAVGARYQVQATTSMGSGNWTTVTNLLLPSSPWIFRDANLTNNPYRFYRVVGTP